MYIALESLEVYGDSSNVYTSLFKHLCERSQVKQQGFGILAVFKPKPTFGGFDELKLLARLHVLGTTLPNQWHG